LLATNHFCFYRGITHRHVLPSCCSGLGFVTALARRENVIVFAGARDPSTASALHELQEEHPGKVFLLKLISADEAGNRAAIQEIKEKAGRLDVVIANAGKSKST
jgi:NAD(P)-dependent dehydrogenase (short-subunit alcohol dehydrogenase family)